MEIDIDSNSVDSFDSTSSESKVNDKSPYTPPPKIRIPFDIKEQGQRQTQENKQSSHSSQEDKNSSHSSHSSQEDKNSSHSSHSSQEPQKKYTFWRYLCNTLFCRSL